MVAGWLATSRNVALSHEESEKAHVAVIHPFNAATMGVHSYSMGTILLLCMGCLCVFPCHLVRPGQNNARKEENWCVTVCV